MRQDDLYNPAPVDMQLAMEGCGNKGEELMKALAKWMEGHEADFLYMKQHALRLYRRDGVVSVKYLLELCRNERHVGVPNSLAPAIARTMEATDMRLRGAFKKHRSCVDGFWPVAGDDDE